mmetsp:Transcript_5770/g.8132  ORF Transcript_5770/g.8132 Transcript_5770/m.8132 type:complete len:85 (+) Transcript_5770:1008-1262(+)
MVSKAVWHVLLCASSDEERWMECPYAVDVDFISKAQLSPAALGFKMAKMDGSRKAGLGDDGCAGDAKAALPGSHEENSDGIWNI